MMKKSYVKTVKKELFHEIVANNHLVETTISDYEDFDFLSSKLEALKNARIKVNNEMQGEGLRRTYVAIGRDWLDKAFVSRWKEESNQIKKTIKLWEMRRKTLICASVAFFLGSLTFYTYAFYDGIKPGFGDSMKCVRSGEIVYDDLEKFTNSVFSEIRNKNPQTIYSFWNKDIPPELQAVWNNNLYKVKEAETCIDKIFIDPERTGIYHIKCKADIPENGNIAFRLQCAKIDGKYAVLALE